MTIATEDPSLRVLVVDDDSETVDSTALLFKIEGRYLTKTASTGREAIDVAHEFHPDIVLLDLAMPQIDGFQVARELRHTGDTQQSVIVAVTGYARAVDRLQCAEAGFDLRIVKPVDFAVLEQLTWLSNESERLRAKAHQLALTQTSAFVTFVRLAIDMANALLDVAHNARDAEFKQRSLAKAARTHEKMAKLVRRAIPDHADSLKALEELQRRCNEMIAAI